MLRILHIVGGMNRGGIETWLMHVLRHVDRERFQMDFLVHSEAPCPYDEEVRALGSKILPCPGYNRPWLYRTNFQRILAENGPYHVVHSHLQSYSGYTLMLAHRAGIPVRIAHSHNDISPTDRSPNQLRKLYLSTTSRWLRRYATLGLAPSATAAKALFGPDWQSDSRNSVLYYGIDLKPFLAPYDPRFRATLQIPDDAFVVGHIGRFVEQKNHAFLLSIARQVMDLDSRAHLLLIGDGPLRPAIESRAIELGFGSRVTFAGLRSDVANVLLNAVDVFVLPSLYEGLGLVGLEAQAAGLPCVFSDTVPEELDVQPELIKRLSLSDSASTWASHVLASRRGAGFVDRAKTLTAIANSPFNILRCVAHLEDVYQEAAAA